MCELSGSWDDHPGSVNKCNKNDPDGQGRSNNHVNVNLLKRVGVRRQFPLPAFLSTKDTTPEWQTDQLIVDGISSQKYPVHNQGIMFPGVPGNIDSGFHHYCIVTTFLITLEVVLFVTPGCPPPTLIVIFPPGWYSFPSDSLTNESCSGVSVNVTSFDCPAFKAIR